MKFKSKLIMHKINSRSTVLFDCVLANPGSKVNFIKHRITLVLSERKFSVRTKIISATGIDKCVVHS